MKELIGKKPEIHTDEQRRLALRGMGYLTLASIECPSGGFGQSARIAALCKESGDNPIDVKKAMFEHNDVLEKLAVQANRFHGKSKRNPYYRVEVSDVMNLIFIDFGFAQELMGLTPDQLNTIATDYYLEYRSHEELLAIDMERRVREMLADKNH